MSSDDLTCDVLVIGAGPAGCTAGLYAARAGLKTVMLSPTELVGMMAKAPVVGNFPGQVEPVAGREILERIRQQALEAGAEHVLEAVVGVDFGEERRVVFAGSNAHFAGAIIVATGAMAPSSRAPGEEEFQGRGVCYCAACDGPLYAGEDVLVVGDDDEAAQEALTLARTARSVCVVSPAPELPLEGGLQEALADQENVSVQCGLRLDEIVGEDCVTGAKFRGKEGDERELPAAGIFMYLRGAAPATDFLSGALDVDENGFIITDELCRTSVPGVFAAGDVRSKQVRQMVVAAGEGATAALAAESDLRQRGRIRVDRGEANS